MVKKNNPLNPLNPWSEKGAENPTEGRHHNPTEGRHHNPTEGRLGNPTEGRSEKGLKKHRHVTISKESRDNLEKVT